MAEELSRPLSPIATCLERVMIENDRLFAVVDAARDTELAFTARDRFGLKLRTLFVGDLAQHLDHVAPHLIGLKRNSGFLDLWAEHLDRSPGILLLTEATADELWAHLRKIFIISDENGEEFSFRYYDPRVLRPYLPTCTKSEAREFFGPIRRIMVGAEQSGRMLSCEPGETGVNIEEHTLP